MRYISGATILGLWMLGAGAMGPAFAADPPVPQPRFEVSGILLQDDGKSWALIAEPQWTGGAVRLFSPGAMIGPYRLVEVQRDHVVLKLSSEASFRVPYSWRGSGGTAVATQTPPDRAAVSRIQAQPPGVPATSVAQPVAPARGEPPATPLAQTDRESEKVQGDNIQGGGASVAAKAAPGPAPAAASVASPPPTKPTGFNLTGAEALRRERERAFRQELSIPGYFYEKKAGAAK